MVNGRQEGVLDMMAEVKSAAEALLERLEAEFPTHSLYVCLEVFDLAAWESLKSAARRSDTLPAEASLKANEMRRKWRRLFEALGLEWNAQTFFSAVHSAMACVARLPDTTPQALAKQSQLGRGLGVSAGPRGYTQLHSPCAGGASVAFLLVVPGWHGRCGASLGPTFILEG